MKVLTSSLQGEALNWCVGVIEYGAKKVFINPDVRREGIWVIPQKNGGKNHFHPSKSWAQGGAIIERERICSFHYQSDEEGRPCEPAWAAFIHMEKRSYGSTALVAAMRAYVALKLGDEVDVPDELLKVRP